MLAHSVEGVKGEESSQFTVHSQRLVTVRLHQESVCPLFTVNCELSAYNTFTTNNAASIPILFVPMWARTDAQTLFA